MFWGKICQEILIFGLLNNQTGTNKTSVVQQGRSHRRKIAPLWFPAQPEASGDKPGSSPNRVSFNLLALLSDYQLESSLEEDLLSLPEIQEAPPRLEWLLQELASLREALSQDDTESSAQADWFALCSKLDVFLFRFYLFVLALYAGTLLLLWASWSFA